MSVDASEDGLAIAVHRTTFTLFDDPNARTVTAQSAPVSGSVRSARDVIIRRAPTRKPEPVELSVQCAWSRTMPVRSAAYGGHGSWKGRSTPAPAPACG